MKGPADIQIDLILNTNMYVTFHKMCWKEMFKNGGVNAKSVYLLLYSIAHRTITLLKYTLLRVNKATVDGCDICLFYYIQEEDNVRGMLRNLPEIGLIDLET